MSENKKFAGIGTKDVPTFSLHASKKGNSNKFISHLLGLDHEEPSKGAGKSFSPSLSGVKITDALQGIKVTPNFMFLLLFLGFFFWLFVIYWVRHNEPLADAVLGKPKVHAASVAADRQLVNGIKKTFPVQTSARTGEVYVPGVPHHDSYSAQYQQHQQGQFAPQHGQSAFVAAPVEPNGYALQHYAHPGYAGVAPQHAFGMPQNGVPMHEAMMAPAHAPFHANIPSQHMMQGGAHSPYVVGAGNYMVGVQTGSGTKVKTIVSR